MTTDKPRGGLVALCVAELVCWGLLYYSLPVAVTPISADMGWSHTAVTAALTVGLIVSALMGPSVGRMLDVAGEVLYNSQIRELEENEKGISSRGV